MARWLCLYGAGLLAMVLALTLGLPLLFLRAPRTAATQVPAEGPPVEGAPPRALAAYRAVDGWCPGLRWQLLAGIGSVESGHGTTARSAPDPVTGVVNPGIFGPPLNGSPGVQRIAIGQWLGWFGLTGPWQQAVGPMQFLPGTFTRWAVDQDGDGVADPHDIDDAVATAANYLCQGREGRVDDERSALLRYNRDANYVRHVRAYADRLSVP